MKLKDFTRKTGREMAAYDFREEIVPFSPEETDELQRHIIYKAIGIAERDMKDEEKGMTPDDSWLAYREARDIYNAHREGLVPDGDADSCPLALEILRELAGRQSGYPLLPELKGDVMNSIQTTLNLALELTSQRDMVKRYVADPTSLTDKLDALGPEARYFLRAAYTLGNFIPCPAGCNRPGKSLTKDYWDLTMWYIYLWFHGNEAQKKAALERLFWDDRYAKLHMETYEDWLAQFGTWEDFVEKNYLQDYTEWEWRPYGRPKEFWDGHFEGSPTPKTPEQIKAFFSRAAACIEMRSARMVRGLEEKRLDTKEENKKGELA